MKSKVHYARDSMNRKKRLLASSCLFVHPSAWMYRYWTDFLEIWYWRLLRKYVEKLQTWIKWDNNIGCFTWRPKYAYIVDRSTEYSVARQLCTGNPSLHFQGNTELLLYIRSYMLVNNNTKEFVVAFPWNSGYGNAPQYLVSVRSPPPLF